MVDGDDSFKRPGAVPFKWEIRPGIPKTRPDHDPSLLQPPKKLPPLRLNPTPPSITGTKIRPVSPFAPPSSSFKLKPPPDSDSYSNSPGPPTPYFKSSSPRARLGLDSGASFRRWRFPKSLFGMKKSKSNGDVKKTSQESTSSESDNFYESESTFSTSEESSRGSVSSTTWGSPRSSFSTSSSRRASPLKRNQSDLSSYEKKTISTMAQNRYHF
ncbi:hypothetical protein AALP_AA1G237300 [Arabis alpina]|uniref:Uncharacterized protein n=1 Tax=Arabis alpina TaxID=50452 RepID=A0A087HQ74_ARAAL|nr:hypothetical protein AALP_AA1G237300 [Arabis alpina]